MLSYAIVILSSAYHLLALGQTYASTVGEVASCFRNNVQECREQCMGHLATNNATAAEYANACFDLELTRLDVVENCVMASGINPDDECFTVLVKSDAGKTSEQPQMPRHRSRFSPMKQYPFFRCLLECNKGPEGCTQGCDEPDLITQSVLRSCYKDGRKISDGDVFQCLLSATGNL
jgi:hypothetical protein